METIRARATDLLPSVLLTVLSMIQALALDFGALLVAIGALAHQLAVARRYWEQSLSYSTSSEVVD